MKSPRRRLEASQADIHSALYNFKAMGRFDHRGITYCVGDTCVPVMDHPDYPEGCWQTIFYIFKGERCTGFAVQEFDKKDDYLTYNNQTARMNTAKRCAREHIDDMLDVDKATCGMIGNG